MRTTNDIDQLYAPGGRLPARRSPFVAVAVLTIAVACAVLGETACRSRLRGSLPASLADEAFWRISTSFSEPPGVFTHSENLVSNEAQFVHLVRLLRPVGGVYVGVGPEQNFSYIARLRPAMAFIVDIRQENRNLHLLYKALFELSADRADFVSRLFSRARPAGLGPDTSVQDLFAAYEGVRPAPELLETTARLVRERLVGTHKFPLTSDDLARLDYALRTFSTAGPEINYGRSRPDDSPPPSYRALMTATDTLGESRSYLATEETFSTVKTLQAKNLIVPIVGDFAGPTAIRAVGSYVREHQSIVTAFYGSNVEVYLNDMKMYAYCVNLSTLPATSSSWLIGSKGIRPLHSRLTSCLPAAR